jgi:hypothetical protein
LNLDSGKGQLVNLVPLDLVYMSSEILEDLSVPEWTKELSGTNVCGDKGGG